MPGAQSLCCHVHTATRVSAVFYLACNLLVGVDLTVGTVRGKDPLIISYTEQKPAHGYRLFDIGTNIMMLVLMSLSSVLVLISHRKGPLCIVPFGLFMCLDVALSLLSLFAAPWGLPGTPTYRNALQIAANLKGGVRLEGEELTHVTMIFGVVFVLYILLKVYMLQVAVRSYYVMKEAGRSPVYCADGNNVGVKLPSYDDALKMKAETLPPAYQET
ncbi:mtp family protein [Brachyhypopomus gauderio]|uniref:mtp family protein n=1 Tax=Brachyhypopomus gauderio TaxID=698409 RepID=UPI004041C252